MYLVEDVLAGKSRAVSRMITLVERRDPQAHDAMQRLYGACGSSRIIGITGPPGAGKSCLVAALLRQLRKERLSVGVLAVDPSSPFTGGAILGDRARMLEFSSDPGVFIRSLATRGAAGGLSEAVNGAVDILDASGRDVILIETVGVGQNEVDIVKLAHTVILVLVPGYGDSLQAMKAGIMEIADILVVNKADRPGADATANELCALPSTVAAEAILGNTEAGLDEWRAPVLKTSAIQEAGSADLVSLLEAHLKFLHDHRQLSVKNRERRINQFLDILSKEIRNEFLRQLQTDSGLQRWTGKIERLEIDPYRASSQVVDFIVRAREGAKRARKKSSQSS